MSLIALESPRLRLMIDPGSGGKLRSMVSKQSGKEFFFQDRRRVFEPGRGYSYHDMSGWDECFPTVGTSRGSVPGISPFGFPDHGVLWQSAWRTWEEDDVLAMCCDSDNLKCSFTRRCSFERPETLLLEYCIVNHGEDDIPYVYSAHPLLAANEETRVVLPRGMTRVYSYASAENSDLTDREWFDLPIARQSDITGPFNLERQTYVKLFSDRLEENTVRVEYPDRGESLVFRFDEVNLPYLGYLSSQGYDFLGDGQFASEFLLALEPTTGIGDDFATCLRTRTLSILAPGPSLEFWIRFSIEDM